MFKSLFGELTPFEDNDIPAAPHYKDSFSGHTPGDDACSSCNDTNICEYDPLDMSKPIRMSVDDHAFFSIGNTNVCEYDPLDISISGLHTDR